MVFRGGVGGYNAAMRTSLAVLLLLASDLPAAPATLKDAGTFLIGAAINEGQFSGRNPSVSELVLAQFDSLTPENAMKWDALEPEPGRFRFDAADQFVAFGEKAGMFIVGHTLVWHSQTPSWVFAGERGAPAGREVLLQRMRDHIRTVVGRYRGRVRSWDVVNEALAEDGTLRDSPWRRIIGDDYIEQAFRFAHEADPGAELYYNDYGIESGRKREGALRLLRELRARGVPVSGVGIQGHGNLQWPPAKNFGEAVDAFAQLGLKVAISELDIDMLPSRSGSTSADISRAEQASAVLDPFVSGLPEEKQRALAARYKELFEVFRKHPIARVTFWGVTDGDSWLNDFPIKGRTNHPLLFDRQGKPKAAFHEVAGALQASTSRGGETGRAAPVPGP